MPGNSRGTTSVDHERKARLRAAVERAKVALQHSDDEEGAKAPEPAPQPQQEPAKEPSARTEGSRLAHLEASKQEWRDSRREDYEARYPGSPVPKDPVAAYRALHHNSASTTDDQIRQELKDQADAYDKIQEDPDRYEQFLARRATPNRSAVVDKKTENRREFHDDASVVEAEQYERASRDYVAKEGVPNVRTGTKAEQLAQARGARIEGDDEAARRGEYLTEDGAQPKLKYLAKRAAAQLGPPAKAAAEMAGSVVAGSPTVAPTFESGSKIDRLKAAAKVAMKRFGGK